MSPMRLRAALLCAPLLLAALPCRANGRFPLSQRFFQDQNNADQLYLSATFGLLLSEDRGQNWYHVCESALTPELIESDIVFEVMPDGSMLSSLVAPLRLSTDCGCTWNPVLGEADGEWVIDIAKAGPSSLVALVRSTMPSIAYRIEHSADGGHTWEKVGELPSKLQAFTLDAAPSNPARIYVSVMLNEDPDAGLAMATPALLVSDDGGETFDTRPITGSTTDDQPFIAAVDSMDEDKVYVRTDTWTPNEDSGLEEANDALFVTDDAGAGFREVLRKQGKLFGFALSPDRSKVAVGFGDPRQATRDVFEVGIYSASASDLAFTLGLEAPISCLTWNANGFYACFDDTIGVSTTGIPTAMDGFTTVLDYGAVKGPLSCNAATCLSDWQMGREDVASVCDRLAAECDVDPATNILMCVPPTGGTGGTGSGTGGTAGTDAGGATTGGGGTTTGGAGATTTGGGMGATTSGGATSMGGNQPTAGSGQAGDESANDDSGSCGCRYPRGTGQKSALLTIGLITLIGLRRRRR